MFAVIYKFKIKTGYDERFCSAWARRTKEIAQAYAGLGSRLHKASDGTFIAYAQWPSRERWESAGQSSDPRTEAQISMRECCDTVETLYELEMLDDLLQEVTD